MTKYKDLDKELVKKCCNKMRYKMNGHIVRDCDKCPLRRTNKDDRTSFCWFRLKSIYEEYEKEYQELMKEDIQHEDEWNKFIERFETVE